MYGAHARGELSVECHVVHKLAELGNDVDYWTDQPLSYSMEPVLKQPPTLRSFVFHEGKNALARTPRQFAPEDVGKIIKEHGKKPYDAVFGTAHTAIDMGSWIKRCLKIPLVIQVLDVPYWRLDQMGPWELVKESEFPFPLEAIPPQLWDGYRGEWSYWFQNIKNCDAVTVLLSVVKEQMIRYAGADPGNLHVVYHGSITPESYEYYLKREPVVEKKNRVISVNRLVYHKGVDQSIVICKLIQDMMPADNPPEFVFVSTGNEQWYEDLLKQYAKSLLKNVKFMGWVDNATKIKLIRESKVLLDQEWPEGFGGLCLAEAIFGDTQPICWDRRSKKEVYPFGMNFVPKGDFVAAAKVAVKYLAEEYVVPDPKAREFIREFRSHESHAKGILEVLEGVRRR
mgnify:FL=1